MILEYCNCEICGSSEYEIVWNKEIREQKGVLGSVVIRNNDKIIHGQNVVCKNCGLIYVNPRMTKESLHDFYEHEYREIYHACRDINETIHLNGIINVLNKYMIPTNTILDIGAGKGTLVNLLNNSGLNAIGIEPNKGDLNNNILNINFDDWVTDQKFDIITILNTLEHVYSPKSTLKKIRSLLTNTGIVILSVPNVFNINIKRNVDAYLSNAHIYNFSSDTLINLLRSIGLSPSDIYYIPEIIGDKLYVVAKKSEPIEVIYSIPDVDLIKSFFNIMSDLITIKGKL